MVIDTERWIKMFPPTDGISTTIIPMKFLIGIQVNYKKNCHIEFGSYIQTHEEHDNGMGSLNIGYIAINKKETQKGEVNFLEKTPEEKIIIISGLKYQCTMKLSNASTTCISTAKKQSDSLMDFDIAME